MNKFNKILVVFRLLFWKQILILFRSFLSGNVWSITQLSIIGKHCNIHPTVRFGKYPNNIAIGNDCSVGFGTHIYTGKNSNIQLKDGTLIGPFVFMTTESFSASISDADKSHSGHNGNIEIQNNVRIGAHSCILPGVTIGENSSVGAGSVVTKDIPKNSIAVGNPAVVIKRK